MCGMCLLHGIVGIEGSHDHESSAVGTHSDTALEILEKRYAGVEINKDDYEIIKRAVS